MTNPARQSKAPGGKEQARGGSDLCWGRNPVISMLEDDPSRCLKVVVSKTMQRGVMGRIVDLCRKSGIPFSTLEPRAMDAMAKEANHAGVIAVIASTRMLDMNDALSLLPAPPAPALAVLLDHVQDPHNLGAIIRSAEAASASFVALPLRRSSLPAGTVVKTSSGASLRLPLVAVGNVASAARYLQEAGLWAVGLDAEAKKTIYSSPLPRRTLLVVGGEGKGLGRTTAAACDETLSIPISGGAGSLNVSVALGVAMFEWSRVNEISDKYKEGR
jgi:23S rRNA (guanosine2251-2'-O)-methyltransferase